MGDVWGGAGLAREGMEAWFGVFWKALPRNINLLVRKHNYNNIYSPTR